MQKYEIYQRGGEWEFRKADNGDLYLVDEVDAEIAKKDEQHKLEVRLHFETISEVAKERDALKEESEKYRKSALAWQSNSEEHSRTIAALKERIKELEVLCGDPKACREEYERQKQALKEEP